MRQHFELVGSHSRKVALEEIAGFVLPVTIRWGRKHLAPRVSPLEREIDRSFAHWPCTMTNASIHREHLPWQQFDGSIVKINEEAAFQHEKTFIGVGMTVPMISLSHSTYTDFMIVDFRYGVIVVALGLRRLRGKTNDFEG